MPSPLLPSGVTEHDGGLETGADARHLAHARPESYEPAPKARVDEGTAEAVKPGADVPEDHPGDADESCPHGVEHRSEFNAARRCPFPSVGLRGRRPSPSCARFALCREASARTPESRP
jgi:hypothetical protein